jgi:NAD(P)-dependent dehydrogenase (short-subunit alcohol dehydrogenase family)
VIPNAHTSTTLDLLSSIHATLNSQTMDFSLTNKTALVTGSYRGTGFAIAQTLLAEGAKVLVHGITAIQAETAVSELGGGIPVWGDISQETGCKTLSRRLRRPYNPNSN